MLYISKLNFTSKIDTQLFTELLLTDKNLNLSQRSKRKDVPESCRCYQNLQ